jgi:hypothetical protein
VVLCQPLDSTIAEPISARITDMGNHNLIAFDHGCGQRCAHPLTGLVNLSLLVNALISNPDNFG